MKTVGERIRQARTARGLSGEQLARLVGYKTQSGISNLENRATGHGGGMLPKIAEALDVSIEWLLQGPDIDHPNEIPRFGNRLAKIIESDNKDIDHLRSKAQLLIYMLNEIGLNHAIALLEGLTQNHSSTKHDNGAGVHLPAPTKRAA